jgi:hypothetical protein
MRTVLALFAVVAVGTWGHVAFAQDAGTGTAIPPTPGADAGTAATDVAPQTNGGATTPTDPGGMDASTYAVRLRDLEQRINELKEQIFRSKARLALLAETVLNGTIAGAQATIVHENRMSSQYRLVKAVYALDGAPIFNKADEEGSLGERETFDVYNGAMVPGEHTLTVNLEYRGNGYGIFSYLQGYRFKVRSNYTFNAPEGRSVSLRVIGYEKGGATAPIDERPAIRYVEQVSATNASGGSDDGSGPAAAPGAGGAAPPGGGAGTTGGGGAAPAGGGSNP